MARTLFGLNNLVGRRVYKPYAPTQAGIIRSEEPSGTLTVKWLDGTTEIVSKRGLNDFDSLIEDHKKKLNTHLRTLAKLQAMEEEPRKDIS